MNPVNAIEYVPVDSVSPNSYNPNRMTERARRVLAASLSDGVVAPIVVRRSDRRIIDGEQRWTALKDSGALFVPVAWVDLSDVDARIATLGHNWSRVPTDDAAVIEVLRSFDDAAAAESAVSSLLLDDEAARAVLSAFEHDSDDDDGGGSGRAKPKTEAEKASLSRVADLSGDPAEAAETVEPESRLSGLSDDRVGGSAGGDERDDDEGVGDPEVSVRLILRFAEDECAGVGLLFADPRAVLLACARGRRVQ